MPNEFVCSRICLQTSGQDDSIHRTGDNLSDVVTEYALSDGVLVFWEGLHQAGIQIIHFFLCCIIEHF